MKFHEWVTLASIARQLEEDPAVVYAGIYRDALATGDPISRAWVTVEPQWVKARRPYYPVYPAMIPALTRLKLDLDCGLIPGKIGWIVGPHIEVLPHYRRPHPCLVWTGKGRSVPKIVWRKGSIVHREVVERMPSGYEGHRQ